MVKFKIQEKNNNNKKKPPSHFSFFFFPSLFFLSTSRRQSINQNQSLQHPGLLASPRHVALKKVESFLPTSWLQSCLYETAE
jgi:hypothetical protein